MPEFLNRFTGISKLVAAVIVVALLTAFALSLTRGSGKNYVTADFEQTNSLYVGSDVKILGVPVGKVETLTPRGDSVRVKMSYDGNHKLPEDVKAVVVSPSIVGDRFVQLAPAYSGGPVLADHAKLGLERTVVPIELDAIYQSLDDLSVALGPQGANKEGALAALLDSSAKALDGQGAQLNQTLRDFGDLSQTLANNKDDLFTSLREINDFVAMLRNNDTAVRDFFDSTAEVADVLEGERQDLAATLKALSLALVEVNKLVKENRGSLRSNVKNLQVIAKMLSTHESELQELLMSAPTALSNVAFTYNGKQGTLDNRADITELLGGLTENPVSLLCNLLGEKVPASGGLCTGLADILEPALGKLPKPSLPRVPVTPSTSPDRVNTSLADMLGVGE